MAKWKSLSKNSMPSKTSALIDIFSTDKTGTWPRWNCFGVSAWYPWRVGPISPSPGLLEFLFPNRAKNLMDRAIINRTQKEAKKHEIVRDLDQTFHKIDELPFLIWNRSSHECCQRRRRCGQYRPHMPLEEMLSYRLMLSTKGEIKRLTDEVRQEVLAEAAQLNEQGLRVLGVSYKTDFGRKWHL